MNKYEIMFIVKPDVEDDARNALIESFKGILTANGGTVDNVDEWGLRDLAYEIKDYKKGYYVVVDATCTAAEGVAPLLIGHDQDDMRLTALYGHGGRDDGLCLFPAFAMRHPRKCRTQTDSEG